MLREQIGKGVTIGSIKAVICCLLMLSVMVVFTSLSEAAEGADKSPKTKSGARYISLDFNNVDIRLFIQYISELSGENFVIDKAVQGNVTILSPTKISADDAYRVFESVLEIHGFTTVPSGPVIKIVPSATARSKSIETLQMGDDVEPEDKVVTQLVPLKFTSPDELKKVLTPLVSKASVVISHPQSGMLILTETLSNIQRLMTIIEHLDVEYSTEKIAVIPLENADSSSVAKILSTIYQRGGATPKGAAAKPVVRVVPYERVNSIVVLASQEEITRVMKLVAELDTPIERDVGNIHVFYLQNAYAVELAKVLNALAGEKSVEVEKGKAPSISKNVLVMPDEETNSLIITASREEYVVLETVIKKLDIPRQMVYLEALILEVDTNKDFDVGVEWAGAGVFDDGTGKLLTGFSGNNENPFDLLQGAAGDEPSLASGFTFGAFKQGIKIGGVTFPSVGAILRAYKNDSDINIISTPQILTTDNKEAEITVGENIPYITSQNTTASEQDYTQYEYRDVATSLKITPHISRSDTMRLDIETSITKLQATSLELTPTTFIRTATTSVIVNDQDTVVIGGIIGQDFSLTEVKVPWLGDIPYLGWLFKTQSQTLTKTNMFIFITPRIVNNPADIAAVTIEKEENIETVLPGSQSRIHKPVNPQHATQLAERGYHKLLDDDYLEAEQYFYKALEIDPVNPYALLNMGVVAEHRGEVTEAIDYYQQVITLDTRDTAVLASDPDKEGMSLLQVARENIERLRDSFIKE